MSSNFISGLRSIALGAPEAPKTAEFYTASWGLEVVARTTEAVYLRGTGANHHILSLNERPEPCIVRLELGAPDRAAVDAAHTRCQNKGTQVLRVPGDLDTPGGGYGFDFVDLEQRVIRISADVKPQKLVSAHDRPGRLSHIVLNTPEPEAAQQFYGDLLEFEVSDWSEDQIVFIRCNREHHNLAFFRAPHASINHVAYDMEDIDAVMRGIGRMKRYGYPVKWGIGRHGPGNNVFAYFIDPNGFVIEYTCYLEHIQDSQHEPRVWERSPELMDRWGTSDPPTAEIREAMTGAPDPGYGGLG